MQLRLKFEEKLNKMHSDYRDLNTRYDRSISDLDEGKTEIAELKETIKNNNNLMIEQKQGLAEFKSKNDQFTEKIQSLRRELDVKIKTMTETDNKQSKLQDDLDLSLYKL